MPKDVIRRVRLSPYRPNMGPRFALTVWDTGRTGAYGKSILGYRLTERNGRHARTVLFQGENFACSPCHAIDSDATLAALLGFLTLRPGDTDAEYFESYSARQLQFAREHGETLAYETYVRFGENLKEREPNHDLDYHRR